MPSAETHQRSRNIQSSIRHFLVPEETADISRSSVIFGELRIVWSVVVSKDPAMQNVAFIGGSIRWSGCFSAGRTTCVSGRAILEAAHAVYDLRILESRSEQSLSHGENVPCFRYAVRRQSHPRFRLVFGICRKDGEEGGTWDW